MIRRLNRSRLSFWALILALSVFTTASPARAADCPAVDENDLPRDCTLTEEYGQCLWDAYYSYYQCLEWAGWSSWRREACNLAGAIDLAACTVTAPIERLISLAIDER